MNYQYDLLSAAAAWCSESLERMTSLGVGVEVTGPSAEYGKNSIVIGFTTQRVLLIATIWESGEAELLDSLMHEADCDPMLRGETYLSDARAIKEWLDQILCDLSSEDPV